MDIAHDWNLSSWMSRSILIWCPFHSCFKGKAASGHSRIEYSRPSDNFCWKNSEYISFWKGELRMCLCLELAVSRSNEKLNKVLVFIPRVLERTWHAIMRRYKCYWQWAVVTIKAFASNKDTLFCGAIGRRIRLYTTFQRQSLLKQAGQNSRERRGNGLMPTLNEEHFRAHDF